MHGQPHALIGELGGHLARRRGRTRVDPVRDQHDRPLGRIRGQLVRSGAKGVADRGVPAGLQAGDLGAQPVLVHGPDGREGADVLASGGVVLRRVANLRAVGEHPHVRRIRQRIHQIRGRTLGHIQSGAALVGLEHRRGGIHDDRQLSIRRARSAGVAGPAGGRRRRRRRTTGGLRAGLRHRHPDRPRQSAEHYREHCRQRQYHRSGPLHTCAHRLSLSSPNTGGRPVSQATKLSDRQGFRKTLLDSHLTPGVKRHNMFSAGTPEVHLRPRQASCDRRAARTAATRIASPSAASAAPASAGEV